MNTLQTPDSLRVGEYTVSLPETTDEHEERKLVVVNWHAAKSGTIVCQADGQS